VDVSEASGAERRKDLIRPEAVAGCESHGIARILSPGTGGPTPAPEPSRAPSRTSIAPVSLLVEPVDLLPVFGRKTFSPRVGRVALDRVDDGEELRVPVGRLAGLGKELRVEALGDLEEAVPLDEVGALHRGAHARPAAFVVPEPVEGPLDLLVER